MGSAIGGAGRGRWPAREAADWFVDNGSDREMALKTLLRWEEWCGDLRNCTEYAAILELQLQAATLPAPALPSRKALFADATADRLGEMGSE